MVKFVLICILFFNVFFNTQRGGKPDRIFQKSVLQVESNYEKIRRHPKMYMRGLQ